MSFFAGYVIVGGFEPLLMAEKPHVSPTSIFVDAVACTVVEHPEAQYVEDSTKMNTGQNFLGCK